LLLYVCASATRLRRARGLPRRRQRDACAVRVESRRSRGSLLYVCASATRLRRARGLPRRRQRDACAVRV